jgi:protein SCO1/2
MPRARVALALATLVACALAALVGVSLAQRGQDGGGEPVAATSGAFAGGEMPPGMPPAAFALRDQDGRRVDVRDLRGRPVVLAFLYTHCEDTCPLQAQAIRGALDDLGRAGNLPALAVSVDPANDTPESARRFLAKNQVTGRIDFLLGRRAELAAIWRTYGVSEQRPNLEHNNRVVLLDRHGVPRVGFAEPATSDEIAHDLRLLLRPS